MFRFVVALALLASQAWCYRSAASQAQTRFAIENMYDDTGPGAKGREYAYNTYKTLDDALIAYLDDPDTKLPEHERSKAINKLYHQSHHKKPHIHHHKPHTERAKPVNTYSGMTQKAVPLVLNRYNKDFLLSKSVLPVVGSLQANEVGSVKVLNIEVDPYRWQKEQAPKKSSLDVNYYHRDFKQSKQNPLYSLSINLQQKPWGEKSVSSFTNPDANYYTYADKGSNPQRVYYHSEQRPGYSSTFQRVFGLLD